MRRLLAALVFSLTATAAAAAAPASQVLEYRIKHPTFGDVGSYVNTVSRTGTRTEVETRISIRVTLLGAVVYQQQAARREHWEGGRLRAFTGITQINGKVVEVSGTAQGESFVISGPDGVVVAPADVHPANPWSPRILEADAMLSPANGHVHVGRIIATSTEDIRQPDGSSLKLKRYDIETDKRQTVWFDDQGIVRAFRTDQDGTPIDFLLVRHSGAAHMQRAEGMAAPR